MALLFVGGVMNLLWVVGLTLIVAIEKLAPRGELFGRAAGFALIVWGVVRIL
jgi:predicted metal-binding membrane protein